MLMPIDAIAKFDPERILVRAGKIVEPFLQESFQGAKNEAEYGLGNG